MENKKVLLEVQNLKKYFPLKRGAWVKANDGISLSIYEGETFGLVGESGCGKSTFGRVLLQLYPPTSGNVLYNGVDLTQLPSSKMRTLRRDLQMIFQDPYSSLNPRMTVGQMIREGLIAHQLYQKKSKQLEDYVLQIMQECGLSNYMVHRYPHQFSGGQRQRIGIARSLALRPKFVVCDEAVSALDVSIQSQIINLLLDLKEKEHLTYLFISHDLSVIKYISDRIGVMYLGNLVELANTDALFNCPMHPYTIALLSAIPTTDYHQKARSIVLEGTIPNPINPPSGCKFHTRCYKATVICETEIPLFQEVTPHHFCACHHIEKETLHEKR